MCESGSSLATRGSPECEFPPACRGPVLVEEARAGSDAGEQDRASGAPEAVIPGGWWATTCSHSREEEPINGESSFRGDVGSGAQEAELPGDRCATTWSHALEEVPINGKLSFRGDVGSGAQEAGLPGDR